MSLELLSLTNPVFKSYTFWAGVLVIKMLSMSLLTAIQRFKTKVRATGSIFRELDLGLGLGQIPVSWVKAKATRYCRHSRSACNIRMHYDTTRFFIVIVVHFRLSPIRRI